MKRFIGKCIILLLLCALSSGCVWKIDGVGSDGFYKNKHTQDYYLSYYRVSSLFCWFIILPPIVFLKMEANAISLDSDEQDKIGGFAVVALINPLAPTKIYTPEDDAWVNRYESVGTQTVTSRYRPHEAELLKHYGLDAYVPNQYQKHELERLPWITDYYYYSPNQKQITWQMKEAFWGLFGGEWYSLPEEDFVPVVSEQDPRKASGKKSVILFSTKDWSVVKAEDS